MKKQLEQRLEALRREYREGQELLTDLEQRTMTLKGSMMRISGAIQVLEEELGRDD